MKKNIIVNTLLSLAAISCSTFAAEKKPAATPIFFGTQPTSVEVKYGTTAQNIQLQFYIVNNDATAYPLSNYKLTAQNAPSPNPITVQSLTDNCDGVLRGTPGVCTITAEIVATNTPSSDPYAPITYTFSLTYGGRQATLTSAPFDISFGSGEVTSLSRTFTFVNNCDEDVWFGIAAGATEVINPPQPYNPTNPDNSVCETDADCFSGSSCVNNQCFWDNPAPAGNNYELAQGASISVAIPVYDNGIDTIWSGGVAGRTQCDADGCKTGDCSNSGAVSGTGACDAGVGFSQPVTAAEFTLQNINSLINSNTPNGNTDVDTYDVTIINGVTVPISMEPTNGSWGGEDNPYTCGTPGNGLPNQEPLGACTWTGFNPPSAEYVWVDTETSPVNCSTDDDCSADPGFVCGLTYDNVRNNVNQTTCGPQLGYWTADAVCGTSTGNSFGAPFNCGEDLGDGSGNTMTNLYGCSLASGADTELNKSCYTVGATSSCCGCQNWWNYSSDDIPSIKVPAAPITSACNGIYNPTQCADDPTKCISNPYWAQNALPQLAWLKEACPTAYTYPYDDMSSTFTCQTLNDDKVNITNYTITFCPLEPAVK